MSSLELRASIFNGENYEFWRIRMTTILKSYGLWELVENGFEPLDPKSEKAVVDEMKKETTDEVLFSEILMKDARALGMIQGAVSDQIFPRIMNEETSKGAWDVLKDRIILKGIGIIDLIMLKSKTTFRVIVNGVTGCTMGSVGMKPGHSMKDCHENKGVQKVNYVKQMGDTGSLFYAYNAVTNVKVNNSWYIDSGYSNHMTGDERLLVNVQRNVTSKVKMGTGEICQVAGKGTLVIETILGRKHIQEVMLVPGLEENLLNVGQLMENGYYLLFGGDVVNIFYGWSLDNLVVRVHMTNNRCFPLTMLPATQYALRAGVTHYSQIWHKRMGHLNERSLKALEE
ncbi:unnamed protein product [Malus baccata var. baccata]